MNTGAAVVAEAIGMTKSQALIRTIGVALIVAVGAPVQAEPRAVIELFTSQGCSSCPPADKLLSELRNDSALVTLSLPIDYWDYLGWKDTLAIPDHTARQKAYSQARGDRQVYTPQVVINGLTQLLGNDRAEIENAVAQIHRSGSALSVPVHVAVSNEQITVSIPNENIVATTGEIWLCPLNRSVSVGIGRGENSGHTITYTNVVRRWIKLGTWSGKGESFTVPMNTVKFAGADSVAVILQSGTAEKPGAMLGASLAALNPSPSE